MVSKAMNEALQREQFGDILPTNMGSTAAPAPDLNRGKVQLFTLNGNATIAAPVNVQSGGGALGEELTLILVQDATGSRTVAFNAAYKDPPTLAAGAANTRALLTFAWDGAHWQFAGGATEFA